MLLPALAIAVAQTTAPTAQAEMSDYPLIPDEEMRPYLPIAGSPQLRFQEAIPPPDVSGRPPAGAPPTPAEKTQPDIVRSPVTNLPAVAQPAAAIVAGKRETSAGESTIVTPRPAAQPPPILPDDSGRKVRPEDFLPFFPAPGPGVTANDVTFIPPSPPAPGQLPPSTATYRQQ